MHTGVRQYVMDPSKVGRMTIHMMTIHMETVHTMHKVLMIHMEWVMVML